MVPARLRAGPAHRRRNPGRRRACRGTGGELSGTEPFPLVIPAKAGTQLSGGYVYILASKRNGTLYTGVTSDLAARVHRHKEGLGSEFTRRYRVTQLVYAEPHARIEDAIAREKAIKKWRRAWKLQLIEDANPEWEDLFGRLHL